jgi:hypothetical protein
MKDLIKRIILEELHKWTKQEVLDLAKDFTVMNHFKKTHPRAYGAARHNGWLDDIRKIMTPAYESWTKDLAHKEALKYTTPNDFQKKSKKAYLAAFYHGWLPDITQHMNRQHQQWTTELLWNEALKYETIRDFIKNSYAAYGAALRRGIIKDITGHMKPLGNATKRVIYSYEFPDNNVYVGLTFDIDERDWQHRKKEKSAVFKHIKNTGLSPIFKQLTPDYINAKDAKNMEDFYINNYKEKGWNILNKAKAGGLGSTNLDRWTKDNVLTLALNYKNITEFCTKERSACEASKRFGWYDEVKKLYPQLRHSYSFDEIKQEALKYKTRNEFKKNSPKHYSQALSKKIIDDVTTHMGEKKKNQFG